MFGLGLGQVSMGSGGVAPSGIAYQRPQLTGQTTSYTTYDDAWHLANSAYDYVPPVNPLYIAELDYDATYPFRTLKNNNAFGNKHRFTSVNGGYYNKADGNYYLADGTLSDQLTVYGSSSNIGIYVIDNLSGLGYYRESTSAYNHTDLCAYPIGKTFATFSDWRATNLREAFNLFNYNSSTLIDTEIGWILGQSSASQGGTSTTNPTDTTKYMHFAAYLTSHIISQLKTVVLRLTMVRNHFN